MPERRSAADTRAHEIADRVIKAIGPLAAVPRLVTEIVRGCRAERVEPPSLRSIRARAAHQRWRAEGEPGGGLRLVIDQATVRLPVRADDLVFAPKLTLAMIDPLRVIVAHALTIGGQPAAAVAAMIADLARARSHGPPIIVRCPDLAQEGWRDLRNALVRHGAEVAPPMHQSLRLGREIRLLIGRRLVDLPLGSALADPNEPAMSLAQVKARVQHAIEAHNRRAGRRSPPFTLRRFDAEDLADGLDQLATHLCADRHR